MDAGIRKNGISHASLDKAQSGMHRVNFDPDVRDEAAETGQKRVNQQPQSMRTARQNERNILKRGSRNDAVSDPCCVIHRTKQEQFIG